MMMTGGGLVARALNAEAVTHLFILCGGHIQEIYNGCLDEGIRVVDVRHEQAAVYAADGWSRVTGVPGASPPSPPWPTPCAPRSRSSSWAVRELTLTDPWAARIAAHSRR